MVIKFNLVIFNILSISSLIKMMFFHKFYYYYGSIFGQEGE